MRILEYFGIRRPNRFDIDVEAAVKQWQLNHAEATECLVCSVITRGANPRDIEIVQESRGHQLVTFVRVKEPSQ